MEFDFPSVIVDLDSSQVKAGLSTSDTPNAILPTVYAKDVDGSLYFGDDIDSHPLSDIYTIFNDGLVYNWDVAPDYIRHIYDKLNVLPNLEEFPLVISENAWSTQRTRGKQLEVAFEELQVPLFSLLKRQVCTAYSVSKPNAVVVVDIGNDVVSVTPISGGRPLQKGFLRSHYGGDFLDPFSMHFLETKLKESGSTEKIEDALLPRPFRGIEQMRDSFKNYQVGRTLSDFKECILSSSLVQLDPGQSDIAHDQLRISHGAGAPLESKNYELPNRLMIHNIGIDQYKLAGPLFRPYGFAKALDPSKALGVPPDADGVAKMIFESMRILGATADTYVNLLNNIVITGAATYIPQLEQKIVQELRMYVSDYTISTSLAPDVLSRDTDAWVGANILTSSSVGDFDHLFVSKKEYEENGESYALDRFK